MCGIAGIIGRIGEANRDALQRMNAAMVHRGPDASGTWESTPDSRGDGVLLTFRRLAILDLSTAAAQPMVDASSGDVLVFNGEIYNYVALRDELADAGPPLSSTGDTAVLLRALGTLGRRAVPRLRGMFAFAFWDADQRELLLARDPLGMKPLYLMHNPDAAGEWSVAFASEVRALLASGLLGRPRLDARAVASVVWNGFVTGPNTAVEGVELVWPGQLRLLDATGRERVVEDFWNARNHSGRGAATEEELAEALEWGLRLHLASDVPLAVFLSGGVDSSAIANLAHRAALGPVHTFTLAFEEKEYNEGPIARRIAESIGTIHTEVVLREAEFVGRLDAAVDSLDQPTFDALNSYYLSQAIRTAGFTVALAGTGGDELFGGYASFRDLPVLHQWVRRLRFVPRGALVAAAQVASRLLAPAGNAIPPQTRWAKLPDMVRQGDDLLALYQLAYAQFLPAFQRQLLAEDVGEAVRDGLPAQLHARIAKEAAARLPLPALSVMEERVFLGERLLRDNDAASMAASIEQRLPLVDQVLFETVDRLPEDVRYQPIQSKAALRRAGLRGLDPALFDRPKRGFVLPVDRWMRQGLRNAIDRTLCDSDAVRSVGLRPEPVRQLWKGFLDGERGINWSRVWALYVLIRWCQRQGVVR